jgi:hypothetical protein
MARNEARKLLSEVLKSGTISFTGHCEEALLDDDMDTGDARTVLAEGQILAEPELEHDEWRYRVETKKMCVVVAFVSETSGRCVTAWRKQR